MRPGEQQHHIGLNADFTRILDSLPALIAYIDADLRLQYCNATFVKWLGIPWDALRGRNIESLLRNDDLAVVLPHMQAALSGRQEKHEWNLKLLSGQQRHLVATYIPDFDPEGSVAGMFMHVKDVTSLIESRNELNRQKSQLELEVALRTKELKRANESLNKQAELAGAEAGVLEAICAGAALDEVLKKLVLTFEEFSEAGMCSILIVDEHGAVLRRKFSGRLPAAFAEKVSNIPIGEKNGSTGVAAFKREVVWAEDIESDPNWEPYREAALASGIRSSWSAPVISKTGKVFGIVAIYYPHPGQPPLQDKDIVVRATRLAAIASDREESHARMEFLATHDTLTFLPNRHLFQLTLSKAISRAQRSGRKFAVMFIDLDKFKHVNDRFGHEAGDDLLKQVAQRLVGTLRAEDTIARLGGDEFIALIEDIEDAHVAEKIAAKLNEALSRRFSICGHSASISSSIGIALFPDHGFDAETLVRKADTAMYFSKHRGRKQHKTYETSIDSDPASPANLEYSLRLALTRGELVLHYQPKYDSATGTITGAEALLRWQHPALGLLDASRFIPLAEGIGLIVEFSRWAVREACLQASEWYKGGHPLRVAVNMSFHHLRQDSFATCVLDVLKETGLPPHLLELELNEGIVLAHDEMTFSNIAELKSHGVYITVDDFGNGYSALNYLKRLPVDGLKIDRTFTQDLPTDQNAASIVDSLLSVARNLHLDVTAMGIETQAQVDFLSSHGCVRMQGKAISEPIPARLFIDLLRKNAESADDR